MNKGGKTGRALGAVADVCACARVHTHTHTHTHTHEHPKHQYRHLSTLTAVHWCLPGLRPFHKAESHALSGLPGSLGLVVVYTGNRATSNARLPPTAPTSPGDLAQGPSLVGFPEGSPPREETQSQTCFYDPPSCDTSGHHP